MSNESGTARAGDAFAGVAPGDRPAHDARMALDDRMTIFCNQHFAGDAAERLKAGVGRHHLILCDAPVKTNLVGGKADPRAGKADVLFGQPDVGDVTGNDRLRLVQLTSAGYTRYDTDAVRSALKEKGAAMCNASSVYDKPCAQHVLAMILAFARALPTAAAEQREHKWDGRPIRKRSALIGGQSALLLGYGAIAAELAGYLTGLGMQVVGVRRSPKGDEAVPVVKVDDVDEKLGDFDHVVNILPAGPTSDGFFDAGRLGKLKRGAYYYSIGRGATTDQDALRAALESGALAGAYLDVTTPEPLPPGDPLWGAPNCHVTPHTAGGFAGEDVALVEHFLANFERLERDRDLVDRVA